jgi:hypothetical protein
MRDDQSHPGTEAAGGVSEDHRPPPEIFLNSAVGEVADVQLTRAHVLAGDGAKAGYDDFLTRGKTPTSPSRSKTKAGWQSSNIRSGYHLLGDVPTLRMPRGATNFDRVRKIGLALPGVEVSTAYGSPALKVRGKLLACLPTHHSAEPGSVMVRIGFDDRAELLAADPAAYYVSDHYRNYTAVLVRLSRVTSDVLRDLLGVAHKFVIAEAARPSPSRNKPKRI